MAALTTPTEGASAGAFAGGYLVFSGQAAQCDLVVVDADLTPVAPAQSIAMTCHNASAVAVPGSPNVIAAWNCDNDAVWLVAGDPTTTLPGYVAVFGDASMSASNPRVVASSAGVWYAYQVVGGRLGRALLAADGTPVAGGAAADVHQSPRVVGFDLISRVSNLAEPELRAHLSHLKNAELLYERGVYPKSTYVFKHALTREVVYDSLLTSRRRTLHEAIGNAIEDLYQDSLAEHYGILMNHFMESDNYFKAAEYARLAGKRAENSAALNDAIAYTRKRVACLEKLPRTDDVEKLLIDARTGLGIYLFLMSYVTEAKVAIDPIVDLALRSGDKRRISQIYMITGYHCFTVKEDFPEAFRHLEQAVSVAEEANDVATSVLVNYLLGLALSWNCEFDKTSFYIEKALGVVEAINIPWSVSIMKGYLSFYAYNYQGKNDLGFQTSREALEIAEKSGDIYSKAMANTTHGFSCFYRGLLEEAESYLLLALWPAPTRAGVLRDDGRVLFA